MDTTLYRDIYSISDKANELYESMQRTLLYKFLTVETEDSLPLSQKPSTEPYPEPVQSSSHQQAISIRQVYWKF